MNEFNGFGELLKRSDLTTVLLDKYNRLGVDVSSLRAKNEIEQGWFTFRHFILEFMLAQDIVLDNLTEKQENPLFLLCFEHKKIKQEQEKL